MCSVHVNVGDDDDDDGDEEAFFSSDALVSIHKKYHPYKHWYT